MKEILIRFVIGGATVSLFAIIGDLFRPKSFAGLFGAAPSVALATLALTVLHEGVHYAAIESASMMAGAAALFFYSSCISRIMMNREQRALQVTVYMLPVWAGVAFGVWYVLLR